MEAERPVVLVTGASRGLGAATARALAGLSADLALTARSAEALEQVAAACRERGANVVVVAGDLTDPDLPGALVARAVEAFGRLDAVVNNAGVLDPIAPLAEADHARWSFNLRLNLLAPVLLIRAALPHLRARRGRVVNVSSGAAVRAVRGWGAYCAAKAALNHVTQVLAAEEPEVTALAFRPGVVDTAMQARIREAGRGGMPPEEHRRFVELHRQGALLSPEKPARSLAALALVAPAEWSGEFLAWDEPRVLELAAGIG